MKLTELRKKEIEELEKIARDTEEELDEVALSIKTAEEPNISKKKKLRKDLARILTIIKEKKINLVIKKKK